MLGGGRIAAALAFLLLPVVSARPADGGPAPARPARVVGVKVYETKREAADLCREWKDMGVNTVFASEALNRDAGFRQAARRAGIARFVILPIFYDPDALKADPALYALTASGERAVEEWVEFVCPSREAFRRRKVESIKELLRRADPDGLSLDFIRHFVFWEKVYPGRDPATLPMTCFDSSCVAAFQGATGVRLPAELKTPGEISAYVLARHAQAWTQWRSALITSMVREIAEEARAIKPTVLINVHAVPWRRADFAGGILAVAGQDFPAIARHVDYLSPMAYAQMLKRPPDWVRSVVEDLALQADRPVLPSIQVGKAYLDTPLPVAEFAEALRQALAPPSRGVVFWSWQALEDEPEKKAVVRQLLKR